MELTTDELLHTLARRIDDACSKAWTANNVGTQPVRRAKLLVELERQWRDNIEPLRNAVLERMLAENPGLATQMQYANPHESKIMQAQLDPTHRDSERPLDGGSF